MTLKWVITRELLWLFCIFSAVIVFWLLVALMIGEGLFLYYLQGLWGNSNRANVMESRLMTVIPALTIYGIRLVVIVVRGPRPTRQT